MASAASQAPQAPKPAERVRLAPRYRAGQTLHYQIDFRTETTSHTAGAVENPQGASQIDLNVSLLLRLDVLSTLPAIAADAAGAPVSQGAGALAGESKPWRARLRATYEKSSVSVRGDSYDPAAGDLEAQYRELAGHAVEFTLESDGTVSELTGLAEVLRDDRSRVALRGWLAQLTAGMDFPREGIALGGMWSKEKHIEESPLAGTVLDTHSTYVRNEMCRANAEGEAATNPVVAPPPPAASNPLASPPSPDSQEMCAVVVTRYEMKQQGKPRRPGQDATPQALRRRGLRSSGTWTSSGESLAYISLATGLTVSVTQSGAEEMNMTVGRPSGGLPFHYSAQIRTETHLTLLPAATPGSTSSVP